MELEIEAKEGFRGLTVQTRSLRDSPASRIAASLLKSRTEPRETNPASGPEQMSG